MSMSLIINAVNVIKENSVSSDRTMKRKVIFKAESSYYNLYTHTHTSNQQTFGYISSSVMIDT